MDIILLAETHVTDNIQNQEIYIDNYEIIRCDSNSRHTGGVAIYLNENIKYKIINSETRDNIIYILSIEIIKPKKYIGQYTIIYHSPSSSDAEFLNIFDEWLEKNNTNTKTHIICGDLNIDMAETSKKSTYKKKLNKIINDHGLEQKIKEYTRITRETKTMIDLIITNNKNIEGIIINNEQITDHATLSIINNKKKRRK